MPSPTGASPGFASMASYLQRHWPPPRTDGAPPESEARSAPAWSSGSRPLLDDGDSDISRNGPFRIGNFWHPERQQWTWQQEQESDSSASGGDPKRGANANVGAEDAAN